jgi:Cytochrome oxidase complex assembly protein 1
VWIIIAAFLAVMLLIGLFVGFIFVAVFGALKSSTPYQHAVQVATHDPRVVTRLGTPVKPGWLPGGSINVSGDSGNADLTISLEGAAHKGKLYVVAKKAEGEWTYQTLAVRVEESQERIDLLGQTGASPEEK